MAKVVAEESLDAIRHNPNSYLREWEEGRVSVAALIYPCAETISARNEIRFLIGDYRRRHYE
jgi:hypothetical protein